MSSIILQTSSQSEKRLETTKRIVSCSVCTRYFGRDYKRNKNTWTITCKKCRKRAKYAQKRAEQAEQPTSPAKRRQSPEESSQPLAKKARVSPQPAVNKNEIIELSSDADDEEAKITHVSFLYVNLSNILV